MSIPAALFVSRQLIRFLISGGVTGLKKNFSFRKKFCSLNYFSICFMLGWVGFVNIQNVTEYFLFAFIVWHFWKIFGGFSTTYLHNIDVVFIKCASKCFSVSCNNVILHKGYIVTTNEAFVCKKRLNKFPETFIIVYFFFRDAFQMLFQRFSAQRHAYVSLLLICQYIFTGRILIHFVVQFTSCVDSFLKFFGSKRRAVAS